MIDLKKGAEDLAATIERKRQEFNAYREKNDLGTFQGLKRMFKKKQEGQSDAERDSDGTDKSGGQTPE